MTKRKQSKHCDLLEVKHDNPLQDRFHVLPDELVIHILSFLNLRQAVRTCLFSMRWRNLWTRIPRLTFDANSMFGRELGYVQQRLKTLEFARRVEKVISHLMPLSHSISSFSVYYDWTGRDTSHIDQWVSFALDHNVETLNLFFGKDNIIGWSFSPKLYEKSVFPLRELGLGGCRVLPTFFRFKNLNLVSLTSVAVTDEAFEDLVSSCLLLVDLFVCSAQNLTTIRIPVSLVRLRHLHIFLCYDLLNLEVNATNLVNFSYMGARLNFSFNNISKLVHLRLSWIDAAFGQLISKNLQLNTLVLDLDLFSEKVNMDDKMLPTLTNLKVLVLSVVSFENGFVGVVDFLRATPSLNQFELHLKCLDFLTPEFNQSVTEVFKHKDLREIVLSGFTGEKGHIELACFLAESAVNLEKIAIIPCQRFYFKKWYCVKPDPDQLDAIRKCTEQISNKLRPSAKLQFHKC